MVYLSPDSHNDLKTFSEDDIYVIGGIIDIGDDRAPLTLANAKKHKIRHARFPMKRVIGMKADLNVETCVAIMNDLKYSQDWFYSLRWVPSRFFHNRLKSDNGGNLENRLLYRAHSMLSPVHHRGEEVSARNRLLTPREHKEYFNKIVRAKSYEEIQSIVQSMKV